MFYAGVLYTLRGTFGQTGSSIPVVKHGSRAGPPLELHLDTATGFAQVTGSMTGGSSAATITAKRAAFTKAQPFASPGRYTALIQPMGNDPGAPQGIGYGAVTVSPLGKVTFAGVLNDGTKVSLASAISADQTWPFYASPYKSEGFISGWVTFAHLTGTSDFSGTLDWGKSANSSDKTYPNGYQVQETLLGSVYQPPRKRTSIFGLEVIAGYDATLTFDFVSPVSETLTVNPNNIVLASAPDRVAFKFNLSTGVFTGHAGFGAFSGAVLQTSNSGGGLILSGTTTDAITLDPVP
jgi:hypothetical protein